MNNDKLAQLIENIQMHSDALMNIPSNEQYIGSIQMVISAALDEIKMCLEIIANDQDKARAILKKAGEA